MEFNVFEHVLGALVRSQQDPDSQFAHDMHEHMEDAYGISPSRTRNIAKVASKLYTGEGHIIPGGMEALNAEPKIAGRGLEIAGEYIGGFREAFEDALSRSAIASETGQTGVDSEDIGGDAGFGTVRLNKAGLPFMPKEAQIRGELGFDAGGGNEEWRREFYSQVSSAGSRAWMFKPKLTASGEWDSNSDEISSTTEKELHGWAMAQDEPFRRGAQGMWQDRASLAGQLDLSYEVGGFGNYDPGYNVRQQYSPSGSWMVLGQRQQFDDNGVTRDVTSWLGNWNRNLDKLLPDEVRDEVFAQYGTFLRDQIAANYTKVGIHTHSGTLLKSIKDAKITVVSNSLGKNKGTQSRGFIVEIELADYKRTPRQNEPDDSSLNVWYYGPRVFKTRGTIVPVNSPFLRFQDPNNPERWITTRYARPNTPKDVFALDDTDQARLAVHALDIIVEALQGQGVATQAGALPGPL